MPETLNGCCCENDYETSYTPIPDAPDECEETENNTCCQQCPDGAARCWELILAGVTNGTCSLCGGYNRAYILEKVGSNPLANCQWRINLTCPCNAPTICGINMLEDTTNTDYMAITISDGVFGITRYRLLKTEFDCNGPNTFTRVTTQPACSFPTTLTIEPIAC